jgi:hypothetical protein
MILDGLSTRAALRSLRRARAVRRCRGRSDVFGNVAQAIFDGEVPGLKPVRFCLWQISEISFSSQKERSFATGNARMERCLSLSSEGFRLANILPPYFAEPWAYRQIFFVKENPP